MARTLIINGTVVSPTGRQLIDVLIDGETVVAMYAPGQVEAQGVTADTVIDALGKYVIPGGIDVHTHMELPFGGTKDSSFGPKEQGPAAFDFYSDYKTIYLKY